MNQDFFKYDPNFAHLCHVPQVVAMKTRAEIFIVDDMASNRELLEVILSTDFEIAMAESGQQCLELLENRLPSLILLDIQMPVMDGYEVCRRIKSNSELNQIQVIMVSAFSQLEHKIKAYEAGCDDYVTMPFDTEELLAKVEVSLRVNRKIRQLNEQLQQRQMIDSIVQDALIQFIEDTAGSPDETGIAQRFFNVAAALKLNSHVIINTDNKTVQDGCILSADEKQWLLSTNEEKERSNWHKGECAIMRSEHITLFIRGLSCLDAAGRGRSLDQLQMLLRCAEISIKNNEEKPSRQTDDFTLSESYNSLNQITQTIADCEFYTRGVMDELTEEIERMILNLALTEEQEDVLMSHISKSASDLDHLEDDFKRNQQLLQEGIAGLRQELGISSVDLF